MIKGVDMKALKYIFIVISVLMMIKDLIGIYQNISQIGDTNHRIANYKNNPPNVTIVARDANVDESIVKEELDGLFNGLLDEVRSCKLNIAIEILETSIKSFLLVVCFKFL